MSNFVTNQPSGLERLENFLVEHYKYEFEELSVEYKRDIIHQLIIDNGAVFTKEFVKSKIEFCAICGYCCKGNGCYHYDPETHRCTSRDNRFFENCEEYPWTPYGLSLSLGANCTYVIKLFQYKLDDYFQRIIDAKHKNQDSV